MTPIQVSDGLQIPRTELPQIDYKHHERIKQDMDKDGINYVEGTLPASRLKPSQDELNPDKIKSIIETGQVNEPKTIFISREGYIVDGHHTWAAKLKHDSDSVINVIGVDMNIIDLIMWLHDKTFTYTKNINEGRK